ncbi:hypothetical protein B566_EDAN017503 [Ephemera danica]|nr:hypothetical protein B566_EDAN017503 [Ephemera danica]
MLLPAKKAQSPRSPATVNSTLTEPFTFSKYTETHENVRNPDPHTKSIPKENVMLVDTKLVLLCLCLRRSSLLTCSQNLVELEDENRIPVRLGRTLKGAVCYVSGDNLSSNWLAGFTTDFHSNNTQCCRVVRMFPPDFMHDVLECLIPYETALCLIELKRHGISKETVLKKFAEFSYKGMDQKSKPKINKNFDVRKNTGGNASTNWALIRTLPIILFGMIPDNCEPSEAIIRHISNNSTPTVKMLQDIDPSVETFIEYSYVEINGMEYKKDEVVVLEKDLDNFEDIRDACEIRILSCEDNNSDSNSADISNEGILVLPNDHLEAQPPMKLRNVPWRSGQFKLSINSFDDQVRGELEDAIELFNTTSKLHNMSWKLKHQLCNNVEKYLVSFTMYPNEIQYEDVCSSIIKTYPCLANSHDYDPSGFGHLRLMFYNRMCTKRRSSGDDPECNLNAGLGRKNSGKKAVRATMGETNFLPKVLLPHTMESLALKRDEILLCRQAIPRDGEKIADLMEETFPRRRHELLVSDKFRKLETWLLMWPELTEPDEAAGDGFDPNNYSSAAHIVASSHHIYIPHQSRRKTTTSYIEKEAGIDPHPLVKKLKKAKWRLILMKSVKLERAHPRHKLHQLLLLLHPKAIRTSLHCNVSNGTNCNISSSRHRKCHPGLSASVNYGD